MLSDGRLTYISKDFYGTQAAITEFRSEDLSKETILQYLSEVLSLEGRDDKLLRESPWYPEKSKGIFISGADEDGKKKLPFLSISFSRCPHCDRVHVRIEEMVSLLVTTKEINKLMQLNSKSGFLDKLLENQAKVLEFSKLFVEKTSRCIHNHFSSFKKVAVYYSPTHLILSISIDADEESTLISLRDKLAEYAIRFQAFSREMYGAIEGYGKPIPLLRPEMMERIETHDLEGISKEEFEKESGIKFLAPIEI